MKTSCGIYGLKNKITGKWYVGQSVDISRRLDDYAKGRHQGQRKLSDAILKHGYENFEQVVLEECSPSLLDCRESFWINHHDAISNGYNIRSGRRGGHITKDDKDALILAAAESITVEEVMDSAKTAALLLRLTKANKIAIESAAGQVQLTTTEFITVAAITFANKVFDGKLKYKQSLDKTAEQ
jgi:group I intron endonuclease